MNGRGNHFIIIDNRERVIKTSAKCGFSNKICIPKISVSTNGVISFEKSDKVYFKEISEDESF